MDAATQQTAPKGHNKPPRSFGRMTCPECGVRFDAAHHRQTFCTPEHKAAFNDRERVRGRVLVTLAQAWRAGRSTRDPAKKAAASFALAELCALGDRYNQEDAAAGRPSALEKAARMKASGRRPSVDNG